MNIKDELESLYLQKTVIDKKIAKFELELQQQNKFTIVLKDFIYLNTINLSQDIIKQLKDISKFPNPQIELLQSLRKPAYGVPKYILGFEHKQKEIILPRGLMRDVINIYKQNNIQYKFIDERFINECKFPKILYKLRAEQCEAIELISKKDFGICVAPPGFGKTLIGAKMISLRKCNTLVIVNKNMLLDQWVERFVNYFDYKKSDIGYLGKSKNTLNNSLDIATMQSLKNNLDIIKNYSFVIVDECHHIPALTFEKIIKKFAGKYVLGLSATPKRKDKMEPILYWELGPIAYEHKKKKTATHKLQIVRTNFNTKVDGFSKLLVELIEDEQRNNLIIEQIKINKSRKILLLTDRIKHLEILEDMLKVQNIEYLTIHGSLKKNIKEENLKKIDSSSLILATASYFGEGVDFPHLDTIIFATPISYEGRMIQYLGRIGRKDNVNCLAIDIFDDKHPMTKSSFRKRYSAYEKLHYYL